MTIAGCILAGGASTRMGGQDKGLLSWHGHPLIEAVIARFAPQVESLMISANRHLEQYKHYGHAVLSDTEQGYAGPLAGVERALAHAQASHDFVAIAPCDAPLLPLDLVARLYAALRIADVDIAYAVTVGGDQPVFALIKTALLPSLSEYLREGERKVQRWYARCPTVTVPFDDVPLAFTNINTPEMLHNILPST